MAGGSASQVSDALDPNLIWRKFEAIEERLRELTATHTNNAIANYRQLVTFASDDSRVTGFAVPSGTSAAVLTVPVTVPDGFTRAGVIAVATVIAANASGSSSYLYAAVDIGTYSGDLNVAELAPVGAIAVATDHQAAELTDLTPGGTFDVVVRAKGDPAWGSTSTFAGVSILCAFAR